MNEYPVYDICVDFDGTIVEHEYPRIGAPVPLALQTLKELQEAGHNLILFTMRSRIYLDEAVEYLRNNGIELYGINRNPDQDDWTDSPKAYGQMYIDDAAVGCPLIFRTGERPYVDWGVVRNLLRLKGVQF